MALTNSRLKIRTKIVIATSSALILTALLTVAFIHSRQAPENMETRASNPVSSALGCDRNTLEIRPTDVFCTEDFYRNPTVTKKLTYSYLNCNETLEKNYVNNPGSWAASTPEERRALEEKEIVRRQKLFNVCNNEDNLGRSTSKLNEHMQEWLKHGEVTDYFPSDIY